MSHTRGRCDSRQEGRECGYYHLHRNLNQTILLHHFSLLVLTSSVVIAATTAGGSALAGAAALVLTAVLTGIGAAAVLTSVGSTVPQNSCQTSAAFPLPLPSLP